MGILDLGTDIDTIPDITCHEIMDPELCKHIITSQYDLKILTMNIRSINRNLDGFLVYLHRMNIIFDVLILTECRLSDSTIIEDIPGYKSYATKHNINQNGGVVAYIHSSLSAEVVEPNLNESCSLLINISNHTSILGIYRSPSFANTNNYLISLDQILNNLRDKQCLIVAGDININTLDPEASDYLCLNMEHGLEPVISKPTRLNACLDHIFIKTRHQAIGVVCDADITDHKIAILGLSMRTTHKTNDRPRHKNITDLDETCKELESVDWSFIRDLTCIDAAVDAFMNVIKDAIARNSKTVKISRTKHVIRPWMTPGLLRCSRHRDRLHAKLKQNPHDEEAKIIYRRYRNFYFDIVRKAKNSYEQDTLQRNSKDTKELWKSVKKICNTKANVNHPTELLTISNCPTASLDNCNAFFSTIGQKLASDIISKSNVTENELASNVRTVNSPGHSFFMTPTDKEEVLSIISQLRTDSAPGADGITASFIKYARNILANPLADLFNLSLSTNRFPGSWKIASVTPVHKGGPKEAPGNYRPISLLSIFSKILEKIVNKRLTTYIEKNGLLSPRQFGFRRHRSTEDAITLLTEHIAKSLDSDKKCVGVFLDLAKAFDTVSSKILIRKLEGIGVRGHALEWFRSYLSDRKQFTKVGQHKSNLLPVSYGVPQGSILGPTLFTIYLNDIHDLSLPNAEVICYADDTVVLFTGKNWNSTKESAERGMSYVHQWLKRNLLTLNYSKTTFMCFHKTAASSPADVESIKIHACLSSSLLCTCKSILRSKVTKYLGIMIDENLNFKTHTQQLVKRIRKISGILRKLRDVAGKNLLIGIYKALCESLTGYCISIWGSAAKTTLLGVERATRSILKIMLKRPFRYSTTTLYKEAEVLTVRQLFILKSCLISHKRLLGSELHETLLNKRVFKLPIPTIKTHFASRFGESLRVRVYNSVVANCDIKNCSVLEAKSVITKLLLNMDYTSTEDLLS